MVRDRWHPKHRWIAEALLRGRDSYTNSCFEGRVFGRPDPRLLWRWAWVVSLAACRVRRDMIRELCAREVSGCAFIDLRQHCCIPFQPLRDEPIVDVLLPHFQVGAFHRILDDVKEKGIVENLEKLHVAVANGPLGVAL